MDKSKLEALAMLYMQGQDIKGLPVKEFIAKYSEVLNELKKESSLLKDWFKS